MSSSRIRMTASGHEEALCASCQCWKPSTRQHWYMQRRNGRLFPHSWCKPCYATNSGRAAGMRIKDEPSPAPGAMEAAAAAMRFLRIPCPASIPALIGAMP